MKVFAGIDELETAVGTHLGYSNWHQITQERVDLFAEATGDHQWIHVDRERARSGPFGGTVAHGFLTMSLLPILLAEVYRLEGVKMGINYGSDRVRFPSPLLVGSKVRAGVELLAVEPTAQGFRVASRMTMFSDRSEKPVCVTDHLSLVVPAGRS